MMKKMIVVFAFTVLSLLFNGCGGKVPVVGTKISLKEPKSVSQVFEQVKYGDITNMDVFETYVKPEVTELYFKRSGHIKEIHVDIGDTVRAGQLLATLDDSSFDAEIEIHNNQLNEMKVKLNEEVKYLEYEILQKSNRILKLEEKSEEKIKLEYDIKIMKEQIKEKNKIYSIDKEIKELALNRAKEKINKETIVASFDGEVIGIQEKNIGDYITFDTPFLGIASSQSVLMNCEYITESEINKSLEYYLIKDNKKHKITYLPYEEEVYAAIILREETPVSTFIFDGNKNEVSASDFGLICIIKDKVENVLTLPNDTIHKDVNGNYVYVDEGGTKVKRYILIGKSDTILTEIVEGLAEGEKIYVEY